MEEKGTRRFGNKTLIKESGLGEILNNQVLEHSYFPSNLHMLMLAPLDIVI